MLKSALHWHTNVEFQVYTLHLSRLLYLRLHIHVSVLLSPSSTGPKQRLFQHVELHSRRFYPNCEELNILLLLWEVLVKLLLLVLLFLLLLWQFALCEWSCVPLCTSWWSSPPDSMLCFNDNKSSVTTILFVNLSVSKYTYITFVSICPCRYVDNPATVDRFTKSVPNEQV